VRGWDDRVFKDAGRGVALTTPLHTTNECREVCVGVHEHLGGRQSWVLAFITAKQAVLWYEIVRMLCNHVSGK
jgi:hypothetical protein